MAHHGTLDNTVRDDSDHDVATLRGRARSLRAQADALDEVLAVAYRRRASELEMQAWLREVLAGAPGDGAGSRH
jgi:hypothetical protein